MTAIDAYLEGWGGFTKGRCGQEWWFASALELWLPGPGLGAHVPAMAWWSKAIDLITA